LTAPEPTAPALALAAWWAGFLTRTAPQDNGDDSPTGGLAATEAGIELSRYSLPIKSGSTGSEHTAEVKQGYQGDWRSIWTRAEGDVPCPW
jgi:hypothetical protein